MGYSFGWGHDLGGRKSFQERGQTAGVIDMDMSQPDLIHLPDPPLI